MNTTSTPPANATWKKITAVCLSAALLLFVSLQTIAQVIPTAHCNSTAATATITQSTPTAIPTGPAVVTSTIVVSGASTYLFDLNLTTFITHSFAADLDITISSPSGTVVTLTTDNGAGNDNVFNGTIWDDDADPDGTVPYTSNNGLVTDNLYANLTLASPLVPEEALGAFIGENPNGTWTITVSDDLAGDGGSLDSWSMEVTGLAAAPSTFFDVFSDSPALALADLGVVSSTILVSGIDPYILDLNVVTDITHTWSQDLDVTITSPAGTVVTLTTDNGGGNENVFAGTTWNDDADPDGLVPYTSNNGLVSDQVYANLTLATPLVPEDALSAFIGEDPNGTWTITISDDEGLDVGTLNSWTLDFATVGDVVPPVITCGANINVNNITGTCSSAAVTLTGTASATDACSTPTISYSPVSGSTFPVGTTTVTATATDVAGNTSTCTFDVIVSDIDAPEFTCAPQLLHDNGSLVNSAGTGFGGADESLLQDASLGMGTFGFGHQVSANNRVADDFTITNPNGWTIDQISFYAYQTGSTTTSTINAVNLRIWDGVPDGGGSVIFGDGSTNLLVHSEWSGIYRGLESGPGATNRPIMKNTIDLGGLTLPAGTYWLDWQTGGTLGSGPWAPPVTITGLSTTGNGLQSVAGGAFAAVVDGGTFTGQGFPFLIVGSETVGNDVGVCEAFVTIESPLVTNECSGYTVTNDWNNISDASDNYPVGTTTVTWTITDDDNNVSTCSFDVTVEDTEAPSIDCAIIGGGNATIASSNVPVAIIDNGAVTSTLTVPFGGSITDVNVLNLQGTHTWVSDVEMALTSPQGTTVTLLNNSCGSNDNFNLNFDDAGVAHGTISCGTPLGAGGTYQPFAALSAFNGEDPSGVWTLTVYDQATGDVGFVNSWSLQVAAIGSNTVTASNDAGVCEAAVTVPAPTFGDNCTGATIENDFNNTADASDTYPVGTTLVTWTAEDAAGNTNTCTMNVVVEDTEDPTITCPNDTVVDNNPGDCGAVITFNDATSTDNCPGETITYSPANGTFFAVGTTVVTATATDAAGNTATCTFNVTVSDIEEPTLVCPANIVQDNDAGLCSAVVTYTPPVGVDNCEPVLTQSLSQTILPGSVSCNLGGLHANNSYMRVFDLPALGYTTDFYINSVDVGIEQAIGAAGTQPATVNFYSLTGPLLLANLTLLATEAVTVADQALSVLNIPLTNQLTVPAGTTLVVEFFTPDGQVAGHSLFVGSNNLGQTGDTYLAAADCGIIDPVPTGDIGFPDMHWVLNVNAGTLTEQTAGLGTGATFPAGVVTTETYQSTDVYGNVATCSFTVTVNDVEVPTISCGTNPPSPLTITQVSNGFEDGRISNALWIGGNGISADDLSVAANTCFDINSISANFLSNNPGSTSSMNVNFYSDAGEPGSIVSAQVLSPGDWTTTLIGNAFGIDVYRFDLTLPSTVTLCAGPSATTYWFSVQGENSVDNFYWEFSSLGQYGSNGQFNLDGTGWVNNGDNFVFDLNGSTYGGLTTYTSTNDPGVCGAAIIIAPPASSDNCPLTLTNSFNGTSDASDVYPVGTTTVTWTVTDPSGNSASCDVLVVVTDDEFPVFSNCPSDIFADNDPGQCGAVVSFDPLEFSDNCVLPGVPVLGTAVPFVGSSIAISDNTTNSGSQSVSGVGTTLGTDVVLQSICLNVTHTWVGDLEFVLESPTGDQITLMSGPGCAGDDLDVCFVTGTGNPLIGGSCGNAPAYSGNFTAESGDLAGLSVGSDPNGTWTLYATDMAGGDVGFVNTWTLNFAPITGFDPAAAIQTSGLPSGSEYPVGTTTNTFEITDASGNTTACSFDVVVSDVEAPTITCVSDIEVDNDLGVCGATVTYDAPTGFQQILEQLGNALENGFVSNSTFPNIGADNFVVADGDCNDISNVTANFFVTNPTAVSDFDVIFYDDNNGEPGNILNTVNVTPSEWTTSYQGSNFGFDIYEYDFNLSTPVTLCGSTGGTEYWMSIVANGTAGFDYFWEVSTAGDYGSEGVLAPSTSGPWDDSEGIDFVFSLNEGGNTPDNCTGPVTVTQTDGTGYTTGDVFPIGTTLQEYTAEDQYGNISFCEFMVTVVDAEAPAIVCPINIIACENDTETVFDLPTATDNCNVDSIVQIAGLPSGSDFPAGITTNTFVAYDPALNTDTCSFTVTITPNAVVDFTFAPTCVGEIIYFTSIASVDTVLGTSIDSYEWEFNDGSGINTDVNPTHVYNTAGDYDVTLTVTTNWGCETVVTYTVTVSDPPVYTVDVVEPTCNGDENGSITINVTGGNSPITFSLNGGPAQSGNVFSGLAAGTYVITLANGCTETVTVTISEPAAIVLDATSQPVLCNGDASGSIEVTATGGTGVLQYSVDGGNTFQPTGSFSGLAAGTYVVVVEDENGCSVSEGVVITEPSEALAATAEVQNVSCTGDASGSVVVNATGGTGAYTYSSDGGTTTQSSNVFGELEAGDYTITVTDANGCSTTVDVTVEEPAELLTIETTSTPVSCNGQGDGMIDVTATGGDAPYEYSFNGGITWQSSGSFTDLAPGTYTVLVSDANGCEVAAIVVVTQPAALTVSAVSSSPSSCEGDDSGSFIVEAAGGTEPYTYTSNGNSNSTGEFTNVTSGTQLVTVTDASGCSASISVEVGYTSPLPVAAFNWFASGSVVQFSNQSDNGTSYDWNFGDGGTSTDQNPVHTYAAGGTYTVTLIVTNACGSDTVIWVIDTNNIGINDPNADASVLNVYPNPNHGQFTLNYTSTGIIGDIQVNVMTIEGKLLMAEQFTVNADTFVRNYSDIELAAGIYIVQFISQTGTEVKRITVDK